MTRLSEITPTDVAKRTQAALMDRLWRLAQSLGITHPLPEPSFVPSEIYLAVQALATYATAGKLAAGEAEFVAEYYRDVSTYADWLGEFTGLDDPKTPLQVVLAATLARDALRADEPLSTSRLAVLASLSKQRLRDLQRAGDAPIGRKFPRRRGKPRLIPADEARAWLSGRGVRGVDS